MIAPMLNTVREEKDTIHQLVRISIEILAGRFVVALIVTISPGSAVVVVGVTDNVNGSTGEGDGDGLDEGAGVMLADRPGEGKGVAIDEALGNGRREGDGVVAGVELGANDGLGCGVVEVVGDELGRGENDRLGLATIDGAGGLLEVITSIPIFPGAMFVLKNGVNCAAAVITKAVLIATIPAIRKATEEVIITYNNTFSCITMNPYTQNATTVCVVRSSSVSNLLADVEHVLPERHVCHAR